MYYSNVSLTLKSLQRIIVNFTLLTIIISDINVFVFYNL